MSGYLVEITMLLDLFKRELLTEKQLAYALWIYEPGFDINDVLWQLECMFGVRLPRLKLWVLSA